MREDQARLRSLEHRVDELLDTLERRWRELRLDDERSRSTSAKWLELSALCGELGRLVEQIEALTEKGGA